MFCMNCGAAVEGEALAVCGSCGKSNPQALSGADVSRILKEASTDALGAIRTVAVDPIGGLAASFGLLGERRARAAGIAFGIAFALLTAIAALIATAKLGTEGGPKVLFGMLFLALVPFAAIAATSAGIRRILGGTGTTAGDVFTAGIALQPASAFFVLAAILGIANYQAIALLGLFAWIYVLCILFTGATRLAGLPERFAPAAIAVMLLVALWLTKVAASALFDSSSSIGRLFN